MKRKGLERLLEVACSSCGGEFIMHNAFVRKRPCEGEEWITEIALVCPHCEHWQHIMLDTADLSRLKQDQMRKLLAYKKARNERAARAYRKAQHKYKKAYNLFHAEWRPKLGLVAPGELLTGEMIGGSDE